jgi:uncharacterized protein (DUF58 family)
MNNIFWALIILFAVAAFLRMDWVYYLVYVVGGVWIFSHFWVRRSLARLAMIRTLPARAFTNEYIDVTIELTNHSGLPLPWLQIQEAVPLDLKDQPDYRAVVSLGGHSTLEHRYRLHCKRRGYYTVGPLTLRTSDLFGFVDGRWDEADPPRLIVYPQVLPLERLGLPSRSPFGTLATRQRLLEDPARLAGVRSYVTGDSLRRIHWKSSAHTDVLQVKKLQPSMEVPVIIVLDLNRDAYPARSMIGSSEWAIVLAASLANALLNTRQAVGLVTNGYDSLAGSPASPAPQRNGQEHLMSILAMLARIQLRTAESSLGAWLPSQVVSAPWGSTLIVITPALDEEALWALHGAFRRGSNVIALLCATQQDFRAKQAHAERLGIDLYSSVWEQDLQALTAV